MDWSGISVINSRPVIFHFWSLPMHTIVTWRAKEGKPSAENQTNKKPYQHGFTPRHCWAIPPNRCSASRGRGGYWDAEKDLLEGFSGNCPASQGSTSYWGSEKGLPGAFSICCLSKITSKDAPSHQTLQHEAQSNSCLPNWIPRGATHLHTMLWYHQSIVLPIWTCQVRNCQVLQTCPQGVSWSFGFSDRGNAGFWDLQRVLSAFGERSQLSHNIMSSWNPALPTTMYLWNLVNNKAEYPSNGAGVQSSKQNGRTVFFHVYHLSNTVINWREKVERKSSAAKNQISSGGICNTRVASLNILNTARLSPAASRYIPFKYYF